MRGKTKSEKRVQAEAELPADARAAFVSSRFFESSADCAMAIGLGMYAGPEAFVVAWDDPAADMPATARITAADTSGRRSLRGTLCASPWTFVTDG